MKANLTYHNNSAHSELLGEKDAYWNSFKDAEALKTLLNTKPIHFDKAIQVIYTRCWKIRISLLTFLILHGIKFSLWDSVLDVYSYTSKTLADIINPLYKNGFIRFKAFFIFLNIKLCAVQFGIFLNGMDIKIMQK